MSMPHADICHLVASSHRPVHAARPFSARGILPMSPIRFAAAVLLCAGAMLAGGRAQATTVHANGSGCSADGFCLRVTVAADNGDPAQCGTQTDIDAISNDVVNYCYTVANHTDLTLRSHSLSDSADGTLFEYFRHDLPPGASYQFNRRATVTASVQSTATWTATDLAANYVATPAGYDFIEIAGTGTPLNLPLSGATQVQLPFPFTFYDKTFETLCVNNNALLIFGYAPPFGPSTCIGYPDHAALPVTFPVYADYPFLAPLWTYLTDAYGNVYAGVVGDAPNRRFVIEWSGVTSAYQVQDTGTATFEVVLSEADGTIAYQYQDVTFDDPWHPQLDNGGFATVGLQFNEALYSQYSYDNPLLRSASAILWTPPQALTRTAVATTSIDAHTPGMSVRPDALNVSADAGTTTSATLTLQNIGTYPVNWSLQGAAGGSRAHFPKTAATALPYQGPPLLRRFQPTQAQLAATPPMGPKAYGFIYREDGSYGYVQFPGLANPADNTPVADQPQQTSFWTGDFVGSDVGAEYVVGNLADDSNELYRIGTRDGALNDIGVLSEQGEKLRWLALRWDSTEAVLYGVAFVDVTTTALYVIDPVTARKAKVGDFPFSMLIHSIAIDSNGLMYGIDTRGAQLVAIDKMNAAATPIGALGFTPTPPLDLAYDHASGLLYFSTSFTEPVTYAQVQNLYLIDPSYAGLAWVGSFNVVAGVYALTIASPDPCDNPATIPWLSFDTPSGVTQAGQGSNVTLTFDATNLAGGTYSAHLCVRSDAPLQRRSIVQLTFVVNGVDRIFRNGFD